MEIAPKSVDFRVEIAGYFRVNGVVGDGSIGFLCESKYPVINRY